MTEAENAPVSEPAGDQKTQIDDVRAEQPAVEPEAAPKPVGYVAPVPVEEPATETATKVEAKAADEAAVQRWSKVVSRKVEVLPEEAAEVPKDIPDTALVDEAVKDPVAEQIESGTNLVTGTDTKTRTIQLPRRLKSQRPCRWKRRRLRRRRSQ